jgi:putative ABC transport system ATP-binding protein/lipoprotein-releasing system ATP-binding protein
MTIEINNLCKEFGEPPQKILKNINLTILDGELVSIVGRSGSGKSTLLYIVSTLDRATSGNVKYDGIEVTSFNQEELHLFRNQKVGFVFNFIIYCQS